MIQWEAIPDPARIERAIKMLIRRLRPTAQGMDGRGGDGGIDSWLRTDLKRPFIFEVKSFTSRLTSSQRRQIERSLAKAAKADPIVWVLILPLEHSPAERAWFEGLRDKYPMIILVWQGVDWLDEQFALHDDLRRYVEGPEYGLLARCKELELERAGLASLPDLASRVAALVRRAQEISPFYRVGIAAHGDRAILTMTPDPAAGQIQIIPRLRFAAEDTDGAQAQRSLKKVLAYGGSTTISGQFVDKLDILDAGCLVEELGPFPDGDQLHVTTPQESTAPPVPCRLRVLTSEGKAAASLDLALTARTAGHTGMSVRGVDLYRVLDVVLRFDHLRDGSPMRGGMELNLSALTGQWPSAIRPVVELLVASQTHPTIEVQLAGKPLARGTVNTALPASILAAARLVILLDDLQELTGVHFPTPAEVTAFDVAMLTALRDLHVLGKATLPRATISASFTGEGLATLLQLTADGPDCALALDTSWQQRLGEHTYPPVNVRICGSHFRLTNRPELQAAHTADRQATARFTTIADQGIEIQPLTPHSTAA